MIRKTAPAPNDRRPAVFAAFAMVVMLIAAACLAWMLLNPAGDVQELKIGQAASDEGASAPKDPSTR
jgi:hypothetical protein